MNEVGCWSHVTNVNITVSKFVLQIKLTLSIEAKLCSQLQKVNVTFSDVYYPQPTLRRFQMNQKSRNMNKNTGKTWGLKNYPKTGSTMTRFLA